MSWNLPIYNTLRWLSRDTTGERGGKNLYAFVLYRPISPRDALGLERSICTDGLTGPFSEFPLGRLH